MDLEAKDLGQSQSTTTEPELHRPVEEHSKLDRAAQDQTLPTKHTQSQPADETQGPPDSTRMLAGFVDRTYTTFVSRARAAERLMTRGMLWTIALAVSSTLALALSVVSLSNPRSIGGKAGLIGCLFSILTLVLSLVVGLFNYSGRARDMFHSYRTIQRVSAEAEILATTVLTETERANSLPRLNAAYQLGLDQSENHSRLDYYKARRVPGTSTLRNSKERRLQVGASMQQGALNLIPVLIILASVGLLGWLLLNT